MKNTDANLYSFQYDGAFLSAAISVIFRLVRTAYYW